jgi:hypothetical protein
MSVRFNGKTAVCEWGGLKIRGTVKNIDLGLVKRTPIVNGDGSVDFHSENGVGMVELEASTVADVELATMASLVDEPMLITCEGRKVNFPKMTWTEGGQIGEEGTSAIKAAGLPGTLS